METVSKSQERSSSVPGWSIPRKETRSFLFSHPLKCHYCGQPYIGEAVDPWRMDSDLGFLTKGGRGIRCTIKPRSRSIRLLKENSEREVMLNNAPADNMEGRYYRFPKSRVPQREEEALSKIKTNREGSWRNYPEAAQVGGYRRLRNTCMKKAGPGTAVKISHIHTDKPINMPNLERASDCWKNYPLSSGLHPGSFRDSQREL